MKIATTCFSLIVLAATGLAQTERQILVTPNAEHPQLARDSGLGGRVAVFVTVDQSGNVVSVGHASGPNNVCPSVMRADVIALRESARTAAANAKFVAGGTSTTISLNFDFPAGQEAAREKNYTAANVPPQDYVGPVAVEPGGRPIPKEISGGVVNGKAMVLPKPPYPAAARAVRAEGSVNIQVLIDEDGKVFSAGAVSGHLCLGRLLDELHAELSFRLPN